MMINAYDELKNVLKSHNYSFEDIRCIGSRSANTAYELEPVFELLRGMDYDNGYGTAEIDTCLVVVMNDGSWFKRSEYDGSEWWSYCQAPDFGGRVEVPSDLWTEYAAYRRGIGGWI